MRNLILAFGLLIIPAVTMAAPPNPSTQHCKFRVLKSSRIVFGKACTKDERRLLPHAIKAVKSPYTLKGDLKTAMRSAQGFYTRNCAKVVRERKATSHNWAECYDRLPSSMMQQQMMIPSISLKTFVWEMCRKIRNLDELALCAMKAATDESGAVNKTIFEAVEAYRTLKAQKKTSRDYIKAVTGGCKLSFGALKCAGFGHASGILLILLTLLWGRGLSGFIVANVEDEGSYHKRYLNKDYICPFGRMWAACRIMIVAIIAIVILLASTTNLYAACTAAEVAGNEVAAQYGMVLYDCSEDEVSQEDKEAVYDVIYKGYLAQKGFLSKAYIRTRWERVEDAFWSVWGNAPLWQAKIAAAICSKETLCGIDIKFSEWKTHKFINKNGNGTQDCGITQINSDSTSYNCSELQDFETAFQEQRRIIEIKVRGSQSRAKWEARIHRYNGSGSKAREYGRIIMSWAK